MTGTKSRFGIPDFKLRSPKVGSVNPACFAGHPLLVVFCPADPAPEAEELRHYASYARDLASYDAWLVTLQGNDEGPWNAPRRLIAGAADLED